MKRYISILAMALVACCCTNKIDTANQETKIMSTKSNAVSYLIFDSEQALHNAINNQADINQTKASDVDGIDNLFTPIEDCDYYNDPILSFDLARVGNNEWSTGQSLYEILHYDDMVPNENFARLINVRGEFRVGDNIYKISPRGTYYYPVALHDYFIEHYAEFENADGALVSENTYQLSPSILRYDTFGNSFEDEDWSNSDSHEVQTKSDPFPPFSWSSYPTHTGSPDALFSNDVFIYSLPTQRRIKTSVFHNNYVVYQERGVYIKCQKKVALGWSDVTSKALSIIWKNLVLQMSIVEPEIPAYGYMGYHIETLQMENGGVAQLIEIRGCQLTQSQIISFVTGGFSTLRSIIMNAVGVDITGCEYVRLIGSDYVQTIDIGPQSLLTLNEKKLRHLFNNNWFGGTAKIKGGQFMYAAIDDLEDFGALRVGNDF